jgi:hypothetical protein
MAAGGAGHRVASRTRRLPHPTAAVLTGAHRPGAHRRIDRRLERRRKPGSVSQSGRPESGASGGERVRSAGAARRSTRFDNTSYDPALGYYDRDGMPKCPSRLPRSPRLAWPPSEVHRRRTTIPFGTSWRSGRLLWAQSEITKGRRGLSLRSGYRRGTVRAQSAPPRYSDGPEVRPAWRARGTSNARSRGPQS